jgi:hypothetical protein
MFICTMKTNKTPNHPFHLHVEYFFRKRFCLLVVLALLGLAIIKSDGKMLGLMREAYAHGFGMIGAYLREETARTPITIEVARIPTITGK